MVIKDLELTLRGVLETEVRNGSEEFRL